MTILDDLFDHLQQGCRLLSKEPEWKEIADTMEARLYAAHDGSSDVLGWPKRRSPEADAAIADMERVRSDMIVHMTCCVIDDLDGPVG